MVVATDAGQFRAIKPNLVKIIPIPEETQAQLIEQLRENSGKIIKFAQDTIVFLVSGVSAVPHRF